MLVFLEIITLAFSFTLLMDPIGNIPIYVAVLRQLSPRRQRIIVIREMIIALATILTFYWVGDKILAALMINPETIQVSGGIILFIIALRMIFPTPKDTTVEYHGEEPFIVPLAIPLVAGPTILAAVMIYSQKGLSSLIVMGALFIAWLVSTIILVSSTVLEKILGKRGIIACERLMGFVLTLISLQMFLEGIKRFFLS